MRRLTALISGKVQQVGYRSRVATTAKALDLKGYVKNLPDGRVLVAAEGSDADLERFCRALWMEDSLIRVEKIETEFSETVGAWDEFYRIAGDGETDSRLDTAVSCLKELIVVVKDGFRETNSRLDRMDSKMERMATAQENLAGRVGDLVGAVEKTGEKIVSEVKGIRFDLKGCIDGRLQRLEIDVGEIKSRMKS
jgi:acylphosphatase